MQLELSKKSSGVCWIWSISATGFSTPPGARIGFRITTESRACCLKKARQEGMGILAETYQGETIPSRPFVEGGIHEAIMEYENNVFFDILAEDLARRDMNDAPIDETNYAELTHRIEAYINEFEENGTDNILVDIDTSP